MTWRVEICRLHIAYIIRCKYNQMQYGIVHHVQYRRTVLLSVLRSEIQDPRREIHGNVLRCLPALPQPLTECSANFTQNLDHPYSSMLSSKHSVIAGAFVSLPTFILYHAKLFTSNLDSKNHNGGCRTLFLLDLSSLARLSRSRKTQVG